MKLFEKFEEKIRSDGVKVTKFHPNAEIYIKSINLKNGDIEDKKITEYSKHENLTMFAISSINNLFEKFWLSSDHSAIVYDRVTNEYKKEKPENIILNRDIYDFIKYDNGNKLFIPCTEIIIEIDSDKTIGYDFTVEDNYTFATFDGVFVQDCMAVYVPITKETIEEVKDKLITPISKDGMGQLGDGFEKDSVMGIFSLTRNPSKKSRSTIKLIKSEDAEKLDPEQMVLFGGIETTAGRVLFNTILPKDYPFVNEEMNKKAIAKLFSNIYSKYGKDVYIDVADKFCKMSYKYSTIYGYSFGMDDLINLPSDIKNIKEQLSTANLEDAQKLINQSEKSLKEYCESNDTNLGYFGQAGVLKGGWGQARQITVAKGLVADNRGNILNPIPESYGDGLPNKVFFTTGSGTRKGISDRVLNTADTGYLSRQLIFAMQSVEASSKVHDCHTKRTFQLKVDEDIAKRLKGRYVVEGKDIARFDEKRHLGKIINLRSPLYCLSEKICATCYGDLLERNGTPYVGIVAASVCGERGTQLIMRTFHSGGAVTIKTINIEKMVLSQFSDDLVKYYKNNFHQVDNDLFSQKSGKIVIVKHLYVDPHLDIKVTSKSVELAYGYFDVVMSDGTKLDFTLDTPTIINLDDKKITEQEGVIEIEFKETSNVLTCPVATNDFTQGIRVIYHILGGKKPWKSGEHFCMKIYNFYKEHSGCDLVHFEVIASQVLRDKGNPTYPARLNPNYQPKIINLKSIPDHESWKISMSFENFSKAVTTGLTYDTDKRESILEKIVSGNL